MKIFTKMIKNEKHFTSVLHGFSEAFVTGKFCDVKVVCKDTNLWAHRLVLSSVSPFLRSLLSDFERRGEDVVTIFLPLIQGYHMKLVLDYIYGGAMYLCGAHMQYVIQVMEVLQLKCGVSVNKMVKAPEESQDPEKQWIEIEHSTMHLKEYDSDQDIHKSEDEVEDKETSSNTVDPTSPKEDQAVKPAEEIEPLRPKENIKCFDGDSDEDNDVVMVELDEDFVVERVEQQSQGGNTVEVVGELAAPSHRCVLCGRTFNHYDNLQVHLTGHLGVKVHLNRCVPCQKNFRNKNELDLHMRSHKFAKMLGKFKINKSKHTSIVLKKKIISTAGTMEKKIVRKYVKKSEQKILTKKVEKVVKKVVIKKRSSSATVLTCAICDKSFGVRSIFARHVNKFHPDSAVTMLQSLPSVNVKKCEATASIHLASNGSVKPKRTLVSPKKFRDSYEQYENPTAATPSRFSTPVYDRSPSSPATSGVRTKTLPKTRTPKTPKTPKAVDHYSSLECPDCSKVFIAKSIYERHLQSARHGQFAPSGSSPASEGYPQWPGYSSPLTPRPSADSAPAPSTSPSTPGGSRIECHLCNQTFVRVKDLAKHREKVCSAYHNMTKAVI